MSFFLTSDQLEELESFVWVMRPERFEILLAEIRAQPLPISEENACD